MKLPKKKDLFQFAAFVLATGLPTSTAMASPPSPDSDTSCGGQCQVICVNGCDTGLSYSWQQAPARTFRPRTLSAVIVRTATIAG